MKIFHVLREHCDKLINTTLGHKNLNSEGGLLLFLISFDKKNPFDL